MLAAFFGGSTTINIGYWSWRELLRSFRLRRKALVFARVTTLSFDTKRIIEQVKAFLCLGTMGCFLSRRIYLDFTIYLGSDVLT